MNMFPALIPVVIAIEPRVFGNGSNFVCKSFDVKSFEQAAVAHILSVKDVQGGLLATAEVFA